jgi:hypothetical protein
VERDRALARGREAGQRIAWGEAYASLSLADRSSSLGGADLELLAAAAYQSMTNPAARIALDG